MTTLPTWDELYQWTCSKESNAIVGESGMSRLCPIATYLKETCNENWYVQAGYAWHEYQYDKTPITMESWMTQTVRKVDAFGSTAGITASVFKSILEQTSPA